MAEVAAVDLRRVGDNANERLRHSARLVAVLLGSLAFAGCSETHHTVGVHDVNAQTSGTSGTRAPDAPAGGGGMRPIDDGSVGAVDAALPIPDAAPHCTEVMPTLRKPLSLFLMIDTNFLVADGGQWDKVQQGILAYSRHEEAAGTGLGLRLIDPPPSIPLLPLGSQACEPGTYSRASTGTPWADTRPLPTNVDEISNALSIVTGSLTTPLRPALQGALDRAFSLKNARPDEEQAVVLMSDAFLDLSCATSSEQLIQTAANGRTTLGIRSYMLELLDPTILLLPDLAQMFAGTFIPLDPVAAAGGTDRARSFNLSTDDPSTLVERLLEIQHDAEPCEYALPAGLSWNDVLLAVDTGVGPGPLSRLTHEIECGVGGGAFVSYVDPITDATWIKACDTSCQTIKNIGRDPLWIIGCDL